MTSGWRFGGEYFAGYLTEKALSIDNLFVFLMVITGFAVPKKYQQKVLMIGIIIALVSCRVRRVAAMAPRPLRVTWCDLGTKGAHPLGRSLTG